MYANASQTLSLLNTDSKFGKFCRFHFMLNGLKAFSFMGASPLYPLTRGSAPGPRWGLCP